MKQEKFSFVILLTCYLFLMSCHSPIKAVPSANQHEYTLPKECADTTNSKGGPEVSLTDSITFNFGNVKAGDTVVHRFRFKNSGKIPLIISSATATCGCTVAHFNKRPINPNQTDSIIAIFVSSKESKGFQNKVVTINYNSPRSPKLLTLYGHVN